MAKQAKAPARERMASAAPSAVYTLDEKKAARLHGKTMLVPSPQTVRDAIATIPFGQSKTFEELRTQMADEAGAEISCPRATTIGWFLVAEVAEEERAEGAEDVTPWWRVTRAGKPDPRLPGGAERHRGLLEGER